VNTSKQKKIVSDEVKVQDDDVLIVDEQVTEENLNAEVRININDNEVKTQDDVNPSREHVINIPEMVVPKAKAPYQVLLHLTLKGLRSKIMRTNLRNLLT